MKTLWKWSLGLAIVMAALGTLAVFGLLSWVADQEAVRLFIDGRQIDLTLPQGWSLVGALAAIALTLLMVIIAVPALVVLALVLGLLGTLLGGVVALLPLAAVIALIVWVVKRSGTGQRA